MPISFDDLPDAAAAADFGNVNSAVNGEKRKRRTTRPAPTFDDLPDAPPPSLVDRAAGFQDDVVTAPLKGLQRSGIGEAIKRGGADMIASGLHAGSDFIDQTVQKINPVKLFSDLVAHQDPTEVNIERARIAADPLGAKGLADRTLATHAAINEDRQAAQARVGGLPGLHDIVDNPAAAIEQLTAHVANTGGESIIPMLTAIATRNPELAAGLIGAQSGTQEYTDLRSRGVERLPAIAAGAGNAAVETATEGLSLPVVMGKLGEGTILKSVLAEAGQEVPAQLGQQSIEDAVTGNQTSFLDQAKGALEAALAGGALGGGAHVASNIPQIIADALPARAPVGAIDPAILTAGNAALTAPAAPQAPPPARDYTNAATLHTPEKLPSNELADMVNRLDPNKVTRTIRDSVPTASTDPTDLTPREPPKAEVPADTTREQLVSMIQSAPTPEMRAHASGVLAAYDANAQEATTPTQEQSRGKEQVEEGSGQKGPEGEGSAGHAGQAQAVEQGQAVNEQPVDVDRWRRPAAPEAPNAPESNQPLASGLAGSTPAAPTEVTRTVDSHVSKWIGADVSGTQEVPLRDAAGNNAPAAEVAQVFKDTFGLDTKVLRFAPNSPAHAFNGFTRIPGAEGIAFINEDSSDPFLTVVAHEFGHDLRRNAPDIYDELVVKLRDNAKLTAYMKDSLLPRLSPQELREMPQHVMREEMISDTWQTLLTDKSFVDTLAAEEPALFEKFRTKVIEWIDNILGKLRGAGHDGTKYYRDVEAMREQFKNAAVSYARRQAGTPAPATTTEAPVASRTNSNAVTDTPAFRKWFGDSKVVDDHGKPLVVYHGSDRDFDAFDPARAGEATGAANSSAGFFFTDNEDHADVYAGREHGGIYDVFLSLQNPKILKGLEFDKDASGALNAAVSEHVEKPLSEVDAEDVQDYVGYLKRRGFDGIEIRYGGDRKNWVAFRPEQIKSATANNGNFDSSNPSILASRSLLRNLTPEEQARISDRTAQTIIDKITALPSKEEMAAIAVAGQAKRGWYARSTEAISAVFGPDAPRFAALLAALSPQTSVESNLRNALNTWKNWVAAGRPTERQDIIDILAASVEGDGSVNSVLNAWINNSVSALSGEAAPEKLSGPKVSSFMLNLLGNVHEVTNDAWMAAYANVNASLFKGTNKTDKQPLSGKSPGYMAMSAQIRAAATYLTRHTGETWTPAEVQETIWSWSKTLTELADSAGETRSPQQLVADKAVTDDLIASTPDFGTLFTSPEYASILEEAGHGEQVAELQNRPERDVAGNAGEEPAARGKASPFAEGTQQRHEARAAARLDRSRNADRQQVRTQTKASKRAEEAAVAAMADDDYIPFSRKNPPVEIYGENEGDDLTGLPSPVNIPGRGRVAFHGFKPAQDIASKYAKKHKQALPTEFVQVDEQRAKRIAKAYEDAKHQPSDPATKRAYQAMIDETIAQYRDILKTGLVVEPITGADPYAATPRLAIMDVVENNHLWFFPTAGGFGSSEADVSDNPLLAETEFKAGDHTMLANDVFRVVHDYFGHIANGVGFRADGEENAWREHSAMYSPDARRAMTSETRGQNSWVNYGPNGEANQKASSNDTVYADQKTTLLPEWVSSLEAPVASRKQTDTPEFKRWFGDSKVVDKNGDPLVVYRGEHGREAVADRVHTRSPSISFGTKAAADTYAKNPNDRRDFADKPRVIPVYLSIQNPVIDNRDDPFIEGQQLIDAVGYDEAKAIILRHDGDVENTNNWQENIPEEYDEDFDDVADFLERHPDDLAKLYLDAYVVFDDPEAVALFKANGFDGAIHVGNGETGDEDEYKVFDESQIKHATDNSGAFDRGNPSFLASRKGFSAKPKQPDAVSADAYHYSTTEGLTELDTRKAGTNAAGRERRRFGMGNFGKNGGTAARLGFYVREPGAPIPEPEAVVRGANHLYRVQLDNLYDLDEDPRGIADSRNIDANEEAISDAGFDGFITGAQAGIDTPTAIVFDIGNKKIPVKPVASRKAQTDTPEFKRWFGKSMMKGDLDTGDAGDPIVFYHGTYSRENFDTFDRTKAGYDSSHTINAVGSWFADTAENANIWAGAAKQVVDSRLKRGEDLLQPSRVLPVYIKSESPLYATSADLKKLWVAHAGGDASLRNGDPEKFRAWMRSNGYDSVVLDAQDIDSKMMEPGHYVLTLDPEQVKSASANSGEFDPANPSIMASRRTPFYSALQVAIDEGKGLPKAADATAWKQWLDGAQRRGDIKQGERDWLGVDAFLDGRERTTRSELSEFVRANQAEVQDVLLGKKSDAKPQVVSAEIVNGEDFDTWRVTLQLPNGNTFISNADAGLARQQAINVAMAAAEDHELMEDGDDSTKFASYQLPGGENYRELLLTLPAERPVGEVVYTHEQIQAQMDRAADALASDDDAAYDREKSKLNEMRSANIQAGKKRPPEFKSSHFDQPNILAHIRLNDRTDADGNKVLFLEEIQSDWHQAGRKQGYGDRDKQTYVIMRSDGHEHGRFDSREAADAALADTLARNPNAIDALKNATVQQYSARVRGVPDAPFKATDEWAMLAFKRAVVEAVQQGKDAISWTTGAQQAERYDLSKQVSKIEAIKNKDGSFNLYLFRDSEGGSFADYQSVAANQLDDYVGKELAKNIIENGSGEYSGDDLKVGGAGMRAFYDKILPSAVNKWAKRFGGRVGTTEINAVDPATEGGGVKRLREETVHSLTITPAMRDAALAGQPLFSRRTPADAQQQRAQYLGQLAAQGFPQGSPTQPTPGGKFLSVKEALDIARIKLQDKMLSVRRLQERGGYAGAPGQTGITLDDAMNAYRLENLMPGRVKDQLEAADRDFILKLQERMKRTKVTVAQLEDYLLARAAPERNAAIAAINPAMPDSGSGISTQQATRILVGAEAGPYSKDRLSAETIAHIKGMLPLVDGMRERAIDNMVRSGQMTPALAQQLRTKYPNYVPMRGKQGEATSTPGKGKGLSIPRSMIKRALGRGQDNLPQNILGELAGDLQRSIVAAEKSRAGQAFLRYALKHPDDTLYRVEPVDLEWKFSEATGEAYLGVKSAAEDMDTTMIVMHNGNPVRIRFEDEALGNAVMNMTPNDMTALVKYLGAINRWRSAVLTRFNPGFTPVNVIRDLLFGIPAIASERGGKAAAKAVNNYVPVLYALADDAQGRQGDASVPDAQKTTADWVREYNESGAKTGMIAVDDVIDLQRKISIGATTVMELAAEGKPWSAAKESVTRALAPLANTIELVNDATENALRASAYISMRKDGSSIEQSAEYAKNLTINFNRKGEWGPALGAVYLFYNASMQGAHAVQRVLRNPKAQLFVGGLAGLQFMLAMSMMGDDDDDGVTPWDMVPDYVKRTSLVIPLGGLTGNRNDYFALPMPYGFNVFVYSGSRLAQAYQLGVRKTDTSFALDVLSSLTEAFSPVPLTGGYAGLFGDQVGFAMQLAANEDDMGRRIAEEDPYAPFDKPKATNGRPDTARPYHVAAQLLARLGGADLENQVPPIGFLDVAPEQLEAVTDYFGGGLGSLFSKGFRWWEQTDAGNYATGMESIAATPIAGRLAGSGKPGRAIADRYYAERGQFERYKAVMQGRIRKGEDPEKALAEAQAEHPELRGIELDRYKKRTKGHRRGEVKRTETGAAELKASPGSPADALKTGNKAAQQIGDAIRNVRDPALTNEQAVAIFDSINLPGRTNTLEVLGLPKDYTRTATAPNRVRQRAIKALQDMRVYKQKQFLRSLNFERRNAAAAKAVAE